VKLTIAVLRDLVMLALGSVGMGRELFFTSDLDMRRVSLCIGLLLGPAALNSVWRRQPLSEESTPTGASRSPSRSPSRRRGS
jgi:hypothetical protein